MLRKLKELGVGLAVDEFGAASSSLAALRRYPVDRLKIDRVLVAEAPGDDRAASLLGGIVELAHALGLAVVAEGVDSPAQRKLLAELACDCMQGSLAGAPVDADAAAKDYV